MIILVVEAHVKPETRDQYIELLKYDAMHSEADEPGCIRFDFLQDTEDPNRFFYYEVYKDEASMQAHRETPHFKHYFDNIQQYLAKPAIRNVVRNVFPADADFAR